MPKGFAVGNVSGNTYYGTEGEPRFKEQEAQLEEILSSGTGVRLISRKDASAQEREKFDMDSSALHIRAGGVDGKVIVGESPKLASFLEQHPTIAGMVKVEVTGGKETGKPLNTKFTEEYLKDAGIQQTNER